MNIILASTSIYRASLLKKVGIPFKTTGPKIEEEKIKLMLLANGATPKELAVKLSQEKGYSVWRELNSPNTIVISGDQVAECSGEVLGKPGTFENAFVQLQKLNGKTHRLITTISVFDSSGFTNHTSVTELKMRGLSEGEITRYLQMDKPFDCAGSYKIEENGIALFESIVSDDFTAIQGIPMVWLCNKLKEYGCEFFQT